MLARAQRDRGPAEHELDVALGVPGLGSQRDLGGLDRAGEELLGERRPVVGQVRLGTDQCQAAGVAPAAQGLDATLARESTADDDEAAGHGRAS